MSEVEPSREMKSYERIMRAGTTVASGLAIAAFIAILILNLAAGA